MSIDVQYKELAEHNEQFLATFAPQLDNTQFLDWAVVVAFYVCVRYVDAYFCPNLPGDHNQRNKRVATEQGTRPIYESYKRLYDAARLARYTTAIFTPKQVDSLIQNAMMHVKTHMLRQ